MSAGSAIENAASGLASTTKKATIAGTNSSAPAASRYGHDSRYVRGSVSA